MKVAKQKRTGGFTLIELIVVIAILGILAGVGTVAYTGYIKAANKGVDKQTVGDLMYAAQLADYANPGLIQEGGTGAMIVISEKGTDAAGGTNTEQLKKALEDSVGSLDAVKLTYMEWAGSIDGATLKSMKDSLASNQIGYTDNDGNVLFKDENGNAATIGYAANADTLWKAVEAAAGFAAADGNKEPGEYLAAMAAYTVGDGATTTGASMGESWSSSQALTNNSSGMDVMISSAGMAIARNFAFAEYLKSNDIEVSGNALQILQATPTSIDPIDWLSYILRDKEQAQVRFGTDFDALKTAAIAYTTGVYSKEDNTEKYSQAYLDGMIYYALMHNVNKVSTNGTYDPTSKTYLTDIGGYVSLAGSVFSGNTDMASMVELAESLNSSGAKTTVVITVTKENGILKFRVKPDAADPQEKNENSGNGETETCEQSHNNSITAKATFTVSLTDNNTNGSISTIELCSVDPSYKSCVVDGATAITVDSNTVVTVSGNTITAVAKGSANVTIKAKNSSGAEKTRTVIVTVH